MQSEARCFCSAATASEAFSSAAWAGFGLEVLSGWATDTVLREGMKDLERLPLCTLVIEALREGTQLLPHELGVRLTSPTLRGELGARLA